MATVEIRSVHKKFGAVEVIHGVDVAIADGEILIADRVVNDVAAKDRNIAMVFQNYALYPHMSVYDNMAFGLRMRRLKRGELDRSVREAANLLGLGDLLGRKPSQLSGGQRQRVALGRAIVRRPAAFLMDEPLSNLDAKLRAQTRLELIRLHRRLQTTTLYVTHDQVEAMTMGERIAVIDRGLLQQVGTPGDIYTKPANLFVAGFVGIPAMSFFSGPLLEAGEAMSVVAGPVTFRLGDTQAALVRETGTDSLTVGVRPEHFLLAEEVGERRVATVFQGMVDVVESLGNEQHVTVLLDGTSVIARLGSEQPIPVGESRRFAVLADRIMVFHPQTGERIG